MINLSGTTISGARVYVTDNATGDSVPLYRDIDLTVQTSNPKVTDAKGKWEAYVDTGVYDVRVSKDGDEDIDEYVKVD